MFCKQVKCSKQPILALWLEYMNHFVIPREWLVRHKFYSGSLYFQSWGKTLHSLESKHHYLLACHEKISESQWDLKSSVPVLVWSLSPLICFFSLPSLLADHNSMCYHAISSTSSNTHSASTTTCPTMLVPRSSSLRVLAGGISN